MTALEMLEQELFKVEGVAICIERLSRDGPGEDEYRYLGYRLMEHFKAAHRAFEDLDRAAALDAPGTGGPK